MCNYFVIIFFRICIIIIIINNYSDSLSLNIIGILAFFEFLCLRFYGFEGVPWSYASCMT